MSDLSGGKTVCARLRDATTASHTIFNAKMDALFAVDEAGYADFLRVSACAVLPLEAALAAAGVERILSDWPARARSDALHADLETLGLAVPSTFPIALPREEAYLFGVLYALESSRLGAETLVRRLDAGAGRRVRAASRYLRHGAGLPLWRSFVASLEASAAARAAPERVARGALAAFAAFDPEPAAMPRLPGDSAASTTDR